MKTLVIGLTIAAATLAACGNKNESSKDTVNNNSDTSQPVSQTTDAGGASASEIIGHYLHLKNALAEDDSKEAANAGAAIAESVKKMESAALTADQKKIFDYVKEDLKQHADHIGGNEGKLPHQREHFDMLSQDMYDLVKALGSQKVLYKDHCPMFNDGKGAIWLSEVKEIKNPYYGKKMQDCGTVQEEIKTGS